jgi:hypothetical protein
MQWGRIAPLPGAKLERSGSEAEVGGDGVELLPKRSKGGLPRHLVPGGRPYGAERRARPGTLGPV